MSSLIIIKYKHHQIPLTWSQYL